MDKSKEPIFALAETKTSCYLYVGPSLFSIAAVSLELRGGKSDLLGAPRRLNWSVEELAASAERISAGSGEKIRRGYERYSGELVLLAGYLKRDGKCLCSVESSVCGARV